MSLANWLMRGVMTTILSGAGFIFITLVLQYAKTYCRNRREKEKARIMAEQILQKALLEERYGSPSMIVPKAAFVGNDASYIGQVRHSLFQMYRSSGNFLGFSRRSGDGVSSPQQLQAEQMLQHLIRNHREAARMNCGTISKAGGECMSVPGSLISEVSPQKRWAPERRGRVNRSVSAHRPTASWQLQVKGVDHNESKSCLKLWSQSSNQADGAKGELIPLKKNEYYEETVSRALKEYPFIVPYLRPQARKKLRSEIIDPSDEATGALQDSATPSTSASIEIQTRVQFPFSLSQMIGLQVGVTERSPKLCEISETTCPSLKTEEEDIPSKEEKEDTSQKNNGIFLQAPGHSRSFYERDKGKKDFPERPAATLVTRPSCDVKETICSPDKPPKVIRKNRSKSVARPSCAHTKVTSSGESLKENRFRKSKSHASLVKPVKSNKNEALNRKDDTRMAMLSNSSKEKPVRSQQKNVKKLSSSSSIDKTFDGIQKVTSPASSEDTSSPRVDKELKKPYSQQKVIDSSTDSDPPTYYSVKKISPSPLPRRKRLEERHNGPRGRSVSPKITGNSNPTKSRATLCNDCVPNEENTDSNQGLREGFKDEPLKIELSPFAKTVTKMYPTPTTPEPFLNKALEPDKSLKNDLRSSMKRSKSRSASREFVRPFSRGKSKDQKAKSTISKTSEQCGTDTSRNMESPAKSKRTEQGKAGIDHKPRSKSKCKSGNEQRPQSRMQLPRMPTPTGKRDGKSPSDLRATNQKGPVKKQKQKTTIVGAQPSTSSNQVDALKRRLSSGKLGQNNSSKAVVKSADKADHDAGASDTHPQRACQKLGTHKHVTLSAEESREQGDSPECKQSRPAKPLEVHKESPDIGEEKSCQKGTNCDEGKKVFLRKSALDNVVLSLKESSKSGGEKTCQKDTSSVEGKKSFLKKSALDNVVLSVKDKARGSAGEKESKETNPPPGLCSGEYTINNEPKNGVSVTSQAGCSSDNGHPKQKCPLSNLKPVRTDVENINIKVVSPQGHSTVPAFADVAQLGTFGNGATFQLQGFQDVSSQSKNDFVPIEKHQGLHFNTYRNQTQD